MKAQVTIEALIIIGAVLLIILSVSVPTAMFSSRAAKDVQHVSDARYVAEEIAAAASSITSEYDKRSLRLYVPGYVSAGRDSNGDPLVEKSTRISTSADGSALEVYLSLIRRRGDGTVVQNESYNFSVDLPGRGWVMGYANGTQAEIYERYGAWYSFNITYRNITFARG